MEYNFITNIQNCYTAIPNLLYYSHIPSALVALFIGIITVRKNKTLLGKILLAITVFFSIWVLTSLYDWLSFNSIYIMITWSLFWITEGMVAILSFYFFYVFLLKKDLDFTKKVLLFIPILPLIILTPTKFNLTYFDGINCQVKQSIFDDYPYILGTIVIVGMISLTIFYWKKIDLSFRKEVILMLVGLESFLIVFFSFGYIAAYYENYNIEYYGLFGMTIFVSFLAYLIVKFNAFNVKLLGAQALVWALVILIGSQFLYLNQTSDLSLIIITAVTLITASILGLILVRSVKKEISLNEKLQLANTGQANLIHIMNHQIKGHLGINKNIFAELLTDDFGKMPDEAIPLLKKGLEESDAGVKYVTTILRGASAESGTLPYDMTHIDISELLLNLNQREKDLAEEKGLAFDMNIEKGNYETLADRTQLTEALQNMIDNSIYYTPKGNVWVNLKISNGKILFSVKDTGVGVKPEDRPKLFKSGGVGKDSMKINVRSSGYGLAFVKGVVEAHKGRTWFESAGSGMGSTFFIELPIIV